MSNDDDTQKAYTASQYLTVDQVAQHLQVSKMTVYRMCHQGDLPNLTIGKSYRIPREEFEAWKRVNLTGMRLLTERKRVLGETEET